MEGIPNVVVGEQDFPEENLEVTVDEKYTFEVTKDGEVKDKGTPTPPQPAGDEVKPGEIVTGSNKTYKDKNNKTVVIPVGFAVSEEEGEQVIDDGLVIKDSAGNEFVWIPVTDGNKYEANTTYTDTNVSAKLQNDIGYLPLTDAEIGIEEETEEEQKRQLTFEKEKELVTSKGGFYISRYEAGDAQATSKTSRTDSSGTTGKLVSKKDAYVYNYITQEDAKEKAKEFTGEVNANVKSGLCTGIQWDMVMAFISSKSRLDGENQEYDVTQYSTNRHHSGVEQTGQNEYDKVCNIYDLEGNYYECVAEKNTYTTSNPSVRRGGSYNNSNSASYRHYYNGNAHSYVSFRFVLYVM